MFLEHRVEVTSSLAATYLRALHLPHACRGSPGCNGQSSCSWRDSLAKSEAVLPPALRGGVRRDPAVILQLSVDAATMPLEPSSTLPLIRCL